MIQMILSLMLSQTPTLDDCIKYDGQNPTQCELALADKANEIYTLLVGCDVVATQQEAQIEQLKTMLLTMPPPADEAPSFSLFGLPGWVTPVAGMLLLGTGVAVGLAL